MENSLDSSQFQNRKKTGSKLSLREREVLQLLSEGMKTDNIAGKLNISPKTVSAHVANIKTKTQICSIATLTKFAISQGITTIEFP